MKWASRISAVPWLALALHSSLAAGLPERFTLARYVPSDVWMVLHGVQNPDARLMAEQWDKVFAELDRCGIATETANLFLSFITDPEARAQASQKWNRLLAVLHDVEWSSLMEKEVVFAERLEAYAPDIFFLCRPAPSSVESNLGRLRVVLNEAASLIPDAKVVDEEVRGVSISTLAILGGRLEVNLLHYKGVVGLITGHRGTELVVALLTGQPGVESIVDQPRFQQALAQLPEPHDFVSFLDIKQLFVYFREFPRLIEGPEVEGGQPTWKNVMLSAIDMADVLDYVATVQSSQGYQTRATSVVQIQPAAVGTPLVQAITAGQPVEPFDRLVPLEALGFSVSSGLDCGALYQLTLDFVQRNIPESQAILAAWEQMQKDWGLNLQRDLFSWLAPGSVNVTFASSSTCPVNEVFCLRVKDPRMAAQKINSGLDRIQERVGETGLMFLPAVGVQAEGFRSVHHPALQVMAQVTPCVGVYEDWLMLGTSVEAVNRCLARARGAPGFAGNARFQQEGLVPSGPVYSASFSDLSTFGEEWGTAFFAAGTAGGMALAQLPEEEARVPRAMLNILGRLGPVMMKIDFLSSASSVTTFDHDHWRTVQVTTYKMPKNSK